MNVVLVCIGNFQEYIIANIRNLIRLKHKNIYVIINQNFKHHFAEFSPSVFTGHEKGNGNEMATTSPVKLVYVESLNDRYHYYSRTRMDKNFRNGFWALTSMRIFCIHAFMEKYGIKDVIHTENDVVLYYNCDELMEKVERNKIYVPFHSLTINVISVIYIPNAAVLNLLLMNWNVDVLDMYVFFHFKKMMPHLVETFPIFKEQTEFKEDAVKRMVCNNFDKFEQIFDGVAIGQYLGGIDPRNVENSMKSTVGFVNKECCIKYDGYRFIWKEIPIISGEDNVIEETMKKPFVCVGEDEIPIFNLHVHSKDLAKFIGGAGF